MKDLVIWSVGNMSEGPISRIHGAALREEGDTTCLGRNSLDVVERMLKEYFPWESVIIKTTTTTLGIKIVHWRSCHVIAQI